MNRIQIPWIGRSLLRPVNVALADRHVQVVKRYERCPHIEVLLLLDEDHTITDSVNHVTIFLANLLNFRVYLVKISQSSAIICNH